MMGALPPQSLTSNSLSGRDEVYVPLMLNVGGPSLVHLVYLILNEFLNGMARTYAGDIFFCTSLSTLIFTFFHLPSFAMFPEL